MTTNDYLQLGLFLVVLLALVKPLGMLHGTRLFGDEPNRVTRVGAPLEKLLYPYWWRRQRART